MHEMRSLVEQLRATTCRCGGPKSRGKTFCWKCFTRLPRSLRGELYRKLGAGYAEAVARCEEQLDARQPAAC